MVLQFCARPAVERKVVHFFGIVLKLHLEIAKFLFVLWALSKAGWAT
jgi:hypothetical protein